jgi:hypothetical protein
MAGRAPRGTTGRFLRNVTLSILAIVGFVCRRGIASLSVVDTLAGNLGGPLLVLSALVALVPLFHRYGRYSVDDRFQPESPPTTAFAFLFGAGVRW